MARRSKRAIPFDASAAWFALIAVATTAQPIRFDSPAGGRQSPDPSDGPRCPPGAARVHARLRPSPPRPGRPRHADGGLHRVHAVPVRRRSGHQHARPGRDAAAAPAAARRPRPRPAVLRSSSGASSAMRCTASSASACARAQGLVADRRAAAGDARAVAARRAASRSLVGIPMGVYTALQRGTFVLAGADDAVADRRVAADLPDRHPADPGVRRARWTGCRASAAARSSRSAGGPPACSRVDGWKPPGPARDHAGDLPAHADHAAGALGDARGAAHRLHQVRARPRPAEPRGPFRPRAQEHAGAGDDDHRPAARRRSSPSRSSPRPCSSGPAWACSSSRRCSSPTSR